MRDGYFITDNGEVVRDTLDTLPVQDDLGPQLLRFQYGDVIRVVQVITVRASAGHFAPNLLVALELWNSRDGIHSEGQIKTFTIGNVIRPLSV